MELVAVLRILARHRLAVLAGLIIAAAAAVGMYKLTNKTTVVAYSSGSVLLAAPGTTASTTNPQTAYTLPDRAALLADLMSTAGSRQDIAREAHIPTAQLAVEVPAMGVTQVATPLPEAAEEASLPAATYLARVTTQNPAISDEAPIIAVAVRGPNVVIANRLVDAVRREMQRLTTSKGPSSLVLEPLGNPTGQAYGHGGRKSIAAALGIVLLGLWCCAVVVLSSTGKRWRTRRRRRRLASHTGGLAADPAPTP
jgi:hypothetical protein